MSFTLAGVSYAYPGARRQVLSGLDLTIPAGATTAILGASGAGKSTLLYLLGLLWEGRLAAGRIAYREGDAIYDYDALDPRERSRLRRSHFGFALQSSYLLPYFTCAQNVAMPLAMSGARPDEWSEVVETLIRRADAELSDRKRSDPALAVVDDGEPDDDRGLFEVRDKKAAAISGGQRQRISVLRSIVHDPQVVFADEPFSSLDALNTGLILDLLQEWRAGTLGHSRPGAGPRSLILVCHDLKIAYDYADSFVVLARGGRAIGGRAFEKARFPNGPDDLHAFIESEARG